MPIDPQILRLIAIVALVILLYAGRMTKGSARETPEGLVFGMKPLVLWTRILAIPLYLALILWPLVTSHRQIPVWLPLAVLAIIGFAAYQLPGTIILTPMAVTQNFWFRKPKSIQYNEVMALQLIQAGNITRVLGDNRVTIVHNSAHAAAAEFRQELQRRTGKKLIG